MMKKKKRILSFLLAVVLMISAWYVPAFAEEITADMDIKAGEVIEITDSTTVKFVPDKSGTYYFMSESENADPLVYLYEGDEHVESFDDDRLSGMKKENDYDFQTSYEFTKGETYYFQIEPYLKSNSKCEFTVGLNLLKHQPDTAQPYVEMFKPEGVTYQWYEAEMMEITPSSAEVTTYGDKSSSYDEATGWSGSWKNFSDGDWIGDFLKKDFVTGESITVKLDGSFGDYSYIELYEETTGIYCDKYISGETDGSYTLTAAEKGTYLLWIYFYPIEEGEPDVSLRAYSKKIEKPLPGETESTLKNREIGKSYFCRMKLADGSLMDSKTFECGYYFSHQPTEKEPYVKGNFEGAEGVTYQWYTVDGQEVTPGSAEVMQEDCTYSAVDGWSGGIYYSGVSNNYRMFQVELREGQELILETKGTLESYVNLYSYNRDEFAYSIRTTDREDETYRFIITETDIYELFFYAKTDDISVKAYVMDTERNGKPVEGETESRLKEPVIGNYYFCRVNKGGLASEYFEYDYEIIHQPTIEEPYVGMNEAESATYQWCRISGEEVTPENAEAAPGGRYEEGRGWIGYREKAYFNPEYTYYEAFEVYLATGEALTVLPKGEIVRGIGLTFTGGEYERNSYGGRNVTYCFEVDAAGLYELYFWGFTDDIAVEAWIGDVTMEPLEGETQNTLGADVKDGLFCCRVKGENGEELQSEFLDRNYQFIRQPKNGAAGTEVNYPEDVAEIRWYQGGVGKEITGLPITESALTSPAVSGEASYPYDAEQGWTGKWKLVSDLYTADFLKADLSTGESISFVVDGTIYGSYGLYDYERERGYYRSLMEKTDDIYTITAETKGTYVLYTYSQTTDVAIRAYRGEITYSPLKNQKYACLYNAEDAFYYCEVEYRNGKTIRSNKVFLEDIETLSGAANPLISQSEPGTISTSWSAADNASGYAVSLYRDGAVAESCTSAALSHTFDITEKGSYFFTVKAEGREGVYINDATVTSAALNIYGVTFDTDGGGTTPEALLVAEGEKITGPAVTPTKDGYTFDGWYNGEEKWDFGNSVTSDLVLTAKWTLAGILGDVDGSGDIKAEDALMVLKSVAHMVTLTTEEEKLADVDKSGDVKAEDALLILKYVAHMVSGF